MRVTRTPIGDLHPDPRNARRHDERNLAAIRASLEEHGQVLPVVAWRRGDGALQIVGGHGTTESARALGWTHVQVVEYNGTEIDARALALRLNRTAELAAWDEVALATEIDVLLGKGIDLDALGWKVEPLPDEPTSDEPTPYVAPPLDEGEAADTEGALSAPFPWFGGKSRAAGQVWAALGDVDCYVEPFGGSAALLLARPGGAKGVETYNDTDGLLCNFWRAVKAEPEEVARWADWPVSEIDLTARHLWLVERRDTITASLLGDPEWYDAQAAGWWVWGACSWIGLGWCSGEGPWALDTTGDLVRATGGGVHRKLPHLGDAPSGVHRKLPHLGDAPSGVPRQLPHLGNTGRGVRRQLPDLGNRGVSGTAPTGEWFDALAARLRRVRVTCGSWERVCTPAVVERHGVAGVVLDPPYPEGRAPDATYANQTQAAADICADVFRTAVELSDRGVRVVVCGYLGTWIPPEGWTTRRWVARKGYAKDPSQTRREVLWCSPTCVPPRPAP